MENSPKLDFIDMLIVACAFITSMMLNNAYRDMKLYNLTESASLEKGQRAMTRIILHTGLADLGLLEGQQIFQGIKFLLSCALKF
jgi:hypothetical protein